MSMKLCKKCRIEKPRNISHFPKRKDSKDGLRNECKECNSKSQKKFREMNRDNIKNYMKNYYLENQEHLKDKAKNYYKNNTDKVIEYQRRYYAENHEIVLKKQQEYNKSRSLSKRAYDERYRIANNERLKDIKKLYRSTKKAKELKRVSTQRRRAKMKELRHDLTIEQWLDAIVFFNHKCCYCGTYEEHLQQDHAIPLFNDGEYTKSNIVPACPRCNFSKNNNDLFKWFKRQSFYSLERENKLIEYFEIHKD